MKTSRSIITSVGTLLCALGIIFTACKKTEIQGPKGDPGTPGVGGNANISSTNTFVVNTAAWVADTATASQIVTLTFTALTQDVVDRGSVKVYKLNGTIWSELPFTTGDLFTQYGFDVGHLYLNYINIEGSPTPPAPATARFRLVIQTELQRPGFTYADHEKYIAIGKMNKDLK